MKEREKMGLITRGEFIQKMWLTFGIGTIYGIGLAIGVGNITDLFKPAMDNKKGQTECDQEGSESGVNEAGLGENK